MELIGWITAPDPVQYTFQDDDNEETNEDGDDEDFDESGEGEGQDEDVRMLQVSRNTQKQIYFIREKHRLDLFPSSDIFNTFLTTNASNYFDIFVDGWVFNFIN